MSDDSPDNITESAPTAAAMIALAGAPNAGKSTLLNRILGRRLSIATPKPQTTQTRILGIEMRGRTQLVFTDTPGIHNPRGAIHELMVGRARASISGADIVCWLIDTSKGIRRIDREELPRLAAQAAREQSAGPQAHRDPDADVDVEPEVVSQVDPHDDAIAELFHDDDHDDDDDNDDDDAYGESDKSDYEAYENPDGQKLVVVLNKVDVAAKPALLPLMKELGELAPNIEVFTTSALRGEGVEDLVEHLITLAPEGPLLFPEDAVTDRPVEFMVAEYVREQLFHRLQQELPYRVAVKVDLHERRKKTEYFEASIYVDAESARKIIIGAGGKNIKAIGTSARKRAEELVDGKVFLKLEVRVKKNWQDDAGFLEELGL